MRRWLALEYDETIRHSWMGKRPERRALFSRLRPKLAGALLVLVVCAMGVGDIAHEVFQIDKEMRANLVAWGRATSVFFREYRYQEFKGNAADARTEAYARVQEALTAVHESRRDLRFVYLVGLRGDDPFIYCDSEPEESPEKSPPGDPYPELPPEAKALFQGGSSVVHGPFEDRWGHWVSVFVKITFTDPSQPPVLLGADVKAAFWYSQILQNSLPETSIVLAFVFMVLGGACALYIMRRLAARLFSSEQAFHDLATGVSDRLWQTDARMNYLYCSDRVREIMGYAPEEVVGRNMLDFASQEERARTATFLTDVLEGQKPFRGYEHWDMHKDGRRVCLVTSGTPEFDGAGRFLGYRGVDTDVTEQKCIEQSLAKRDRLLEAAAEAANHLLSDSHYASGVRAASHALGTAIDADRAYICEIRRGASLDKHTLVLWHAWSNSLTADVQAEPEPPVLSGNHVIPRWFDTLSTGLPIAGCVRDLPEMEQLLLGARSTKSVLVVPIAIRREFWGFACFEDCHSEREWNLGEIMILLSSASAIGATVVRKQAEEGLIESNAWLTGTLHAARGLAVIMTNPAGQIMKFSVGAERMLGYAGAEVIGRFPLLAFHLDSEVRDVCAEAGIPPSLPGEGFRPFVEMVRRNEIWEHDWTYVTKKGDRVRARAAIGEARDAAGELRGYVAVIRALNA